MTTPPSDLLFDRKADLTGALSQALIAYAKRDIKPASSESVTVLNFENPGDYVALRNALPQIPTPLRLAVNLWGATQDPESVIKDLLSQLPLGSWLYALVPGILNGYALDVASGALGLPVYVRQHYPLEKSPLPQHSLTLNYPLESNELLTFSEFQAYLLAPENPPLDLKILKCLCDWLHQHNEPVILSGALVTWHVHQS